MYHEYKKLSDYSKKDQNSIIENKNKYERCSKFVSTGLFSKFVFQVEKEIEQINIENIEAKLNYNLLLVRLQLLITAIIRPGILDELKCKHLILDQKNNLITILNILDKKNDTDWVRPIIVRPNVISVLQVCIQKYSTDDYVFDTQFKKQQINFDITNDTLTIEARSSLSETNNEMFKEFLKKLIKEDDDQSLLDLINGIHLMDIRTTFANIVVYKCLFDIEWRKDHIDMFYEYNLEIHSMLEDTPNSDINKAFYIARHLLHHLLESSFYHLAVMCYIDPRNIVKFCSKEFGKDYRYSWLYCYSLGNSSYSPCLVFELTESQLNEHTYLIDDAVLSKLKIDSFM